MIRTLTLAALLALTTTAFAQEQGLSFTLGPIERIEDSDIVRSFGVVQNNIGDVRDITVAVSVLAPLTIYIGAQSDANWTCSNGSDPYTVFCTTPLMRMGETLPVQIYAGPIRHGNIELVGRASWHYFEGSFQTPVVEQNARFARELVVTNTGDKGEGTLRAAIETMNALPEAVPVDIVFNIPGPAPERGWYTIYPNTPLPAIQWTDVVIDGATQTAFGGDTNPLGPEIELDGAATWFGNGLHITGSGLTTVRNLAIGGFPWNGIAVTSDSGVNSRIEDNYIGTDATGTRANPNRSRGIAFDHPTRNFEVSRNIISGNGRSGVFIGTTSHWIKLIENRIGIGSNGAAIPNGASGVFLGGEFSSDFWLERNTIAHNTWFGLAIDRRLHTYTLVDNSITRNGFIGIDRGLDGFDGYALNVDYTNITNAQVPPPRITSALYNPTLNVTTITGTFFPERENFRTSELTLYASTVADGQGETVLGTTSTPTGTFTFIAPGNLVGKFITATGRHTLEIDLGGFHFWHSEFSEPVEVAMRID